VSCILWDMGQKVGLDDMWDRKWVLPIVDSKKIADGGTCGRLDDLSRVGRRIGEIIQKKLRTRETCGEEGGKISGGRIFIWGEDIHLGQGGVRGERRFGTRFTCGPWSRSWRACRSCVGHQNAWTCTCPRLRATQST